TGINCPAVTTTPLSVSDPGAGTVVILTARKLFAGESSGSVKPKSPDVKLYVVFSSIVMVVAVPTGGSFTGVTVIFRVAILLSDWPSLTMNAMVRVVVSGASLVLK